jgi:hypothetical protein
MGSSEADFDRLISMLKPYPGQGPVRLRAGSANLYGQDSSTGVVWAPQAPAESADRYRVRIAPVQIWRTGWLAAQTHRRQLRWVRCVPDEATVTKLFEVVRQAVMRSPNYSLDAPLVEAWNQYPPTTLTKPLPMPAAMQP